MAKARPDLFATGGKSGLETVKGVEPYKVVNMGFVMFSPICPHLGCSVSWQKGQGEFVCPCHGGRFMPDGLQIFGPPPRAMDRLSTRVEGGMLQVHFEYFRSNVSNQQKLS